MHNVFVMHVNAHFISLLRPNVGALGGLSPAHC